MAKTTEFERWSSRKHDPDSRLPAAELGMNVLYFLIIFVATAMVYANIDAFNRYVLWVFRLGSLALLLGTYFCLTVLLRMLGNLWSGFQGMQNGYRLFALLLVLGILVYAGGNQKALVSAATMQLDRIDFGSYNPLQLPVRQISYPPPTGATTAITNAKTAGVEIWVLHYTNEERRTHGLAALELDSNLSVVARDHSTDMASNNFFAHVNLQGEDPTARAIRHGYLPVSIYGYGIGENLGKMPTGNVQGVGYVNDDADSIAKALVEGWMNSPGHRENILTPTYSVMGTGIAYDGTFYFATQNFK